MSVSADSHLAAPRPAREVTEREIALHLLVRLARLTPSTFSVTAFYDDDQDFLEDLGEALNARFDRPLTNKLRNVVRQLVRYGVLSAAMCGTSKEYIDEPARLMVYSLDPRYSPRLAPDLHPRYTPMEGASPIGESAFLLRRAYPAD